jgi:hypothetical protein
MRGCGCDLQFQRDVAMEGIEGESLRVDESKITGSEDSGCLTATAAIGATVTSSAVIGSPIGAYVTVIALAIIGANVAVITNSL